MGADDNIHLALLYLFEHLLGGCGAACAAQILHIAREILEALLEGEVVLVGQYGCGHQYGDLFAVGGGLEGGAYGHFGLAESHIAAD